MSVLVMTNPNFNVSSDAFRFTAMGQISNQCYLQHQQEQDIMSEAVGALSFGMLLLEFYGEIPAASGETVVRFHSDSSGFIFWVIPHEL